MPQFDRFDVCEAYWLFACEWHGGQWSPEYKIFGRLIDMEFRPSPCLSKRSLTENGRLILASLIRQARRSLKEKRRTLIRLRNV